VKTPAEAHMKKLISLGGSDFAYRHGDNDLSRGQDRGGSEGIRARFCRSVAAGLARSARSRRENSQGRLHRLFVFTRDGHLSVQVMERNPPRQTPAGLSKYSHGGYEATFGTYEVDENAHTFTFHVEGALVRNPDRQRPAALI